MTSYRNRGFYNAAYHDSETLEMDRRSGSKTVHANPYARVGSARWGAASGPGDEAVYEAPRGGWEEQSWGYGGENPTTLPGSPPFPPQSDHGPFRMDPGYTQPAFARPPHHMSGNMTVRMRGLAMRRMSMFPQADQALSEDAIMDEIKNDELNLVRELVAKSTRDLARAIRELDMCFEEKKRIRNQVMAFKSIKNSQEFTWYTELSENTSLFFRRCGYAARSARQALALWHGTMKEIGGTFGSSVLTYFTFLKWLLLFNVFSFVVNFGFVTVPLLVHDASPNHPANVTFQGLELLTGAGYFTYTVMYYGAYSNETITSGVEYNLQLAYYFTIAIYMVLCGIMLLFSMASSFKSNYVLSDPASTSAWQLLCSWDFSMTSERTVRQRKNNLRVQLKESLSEKAQQQVKLSLPEKLKHLGLHLCCWFLSTGLVVGCAVGVFYLCRYEQIKGWSDAGGLSPQQEAQTLLVPFVVSLINLVIPLLFALLNKFEHYSSQRRQIYTLVVRNVFLRMAVLGVLCYYWMEVMPNQSLQCWESAVGQSLYRLVIVDFLFLVLGSFFGEFLWSVIGTRLQPRLGLPEFDVARNVLDLVYAQTLAWIGIYFSPLLPALQILKFFILFYLKKVSLTRNCQPPRRSGRAAQMQTIFIFLLFFPFYVGAISIVGYTSWSLTPSRLCGPFRGLSNSFGVVEVWVDGLDTHAGPRWAVWIYQNVVKSEIFYFLVTLIVLSVTFLFWQLIQGRRELIRHLRQQIVNEGKNKAFLLDKLLTRQRSEPKGNPRWSKRQRRSHPASLDRSSESHSSSSVVRQALLARQRAEEEQQQQQQQQQQRAGSDGVFCPADLPAPSALSQAMAARRRAEEDEPGEFGHPGALAQAMQARQRAEEEEEEEEEEERRRWGSGRLQSPAAPGSSALIQAMLARQRAQNEFDDGY